MSARRSSLHVPLLCLAACLVALGASAPGARADELEEKGFGLRFSAGLTRFSRYPDSAGIGGAGGGSPWSSSPNPAASGMNPAVGPSRLGLSTQVAHVNFDRGQRIDVYSASVSLDDCRTGSWQPSLFALSSNRAPTSDGLIFDWDGVGAELQWARKLGSNTSFGVNLNWFHSELDFDLPDDTPVSDSTSDTWGVRTGVLQRFSDTLYAGAALDFTWAPGKTVTHDFMGLGIGDTVERDTTYTFLARPGVYTFLTDDLTLYADYQLAHLWDGSESLTIHRGYAGLDLTVREGVYVRAGTILDHFGNVAFTLGVGIATSETFYLDVAWQHAMFPELDPELGEAEVVSLGFTFLL